MCGLLRICNEICRYDVKYRGSCNYQIYSPENMTNRLETKHTYNKKQQEKPKVTKPRTPRDDYILFMGLNSSFSRRQLKKKFRKLAIKFHPDKTGGDSKKFVYLKMCYDTLKKNF